MCQVRSDFLQKRGDNAAVEINTQIFHVFCADLKQIFTNNNKYIQIQMVVQDSVILAFQIVPMTNL